jgi:hypothetical protein
MPIHSPTRREFLAGSLVLPGGAYLLDTTASAQGAPVALYNTDLQTAIGFGDEQPGILDKFGQLRSRHVDTGLEFGSPPRKVAGGEWSQSLEGGYLPIVHTRMAAPHESLHWLAFSSRLSGIKADYIGIREARTAFRITLRCHDATDVEVRDGAVFGGGRLLASFPAPRRIEVHRARYNILSPHSESHPFAAPVPPGYDSAFEGIRNTFHSRSVVYRFPVPSGKTYHVYLGVFAGNPAPGERILRLTVNEQTERVDQASGQGKPLLRKFTVAPSDGQILLTCDIDASTALSNPYRISGINGIWIFEASVDPADVIAGRINGHALFYVRCGREPLADIASAVTLDYDPQDQAAPARWIRLPYDLDAGRSRELAAIAPESAQAAAREAWESLIHGGAEFSTGIRHLDDLYKSSLINLFLLRIRHSDIYLVQPGPSLYAAFWHRDAAYMTNALGVAGLPAEAEKCLRIYWRTGLKGRLAALGQQPNGVWHSPVSEWDGPGQALWALTHHYQLTGDKDWLRKVYPSIRRGVQWIRNAAALSQFLTDQGERPVFYGLLPTGDAEGIGRGGYSYYHNFWAAFGLRQAVEAAEALGESDDVKWMTATLDEFSATLMASIRQAFEFTGQRQFLPATPYDASPAWDLWGCLTALYPSRFLEPQNPMLTGTLDRVARNSREGLYTMAQPGSNGELNLWTYETVDWAMCYLLRDELPQFYRLFDSYVAHASPTNVWIEGIVLPARTGSGDMPHGEAAAQYIHLVRNSLLYEDGNNLELCWGVQPGWLQSGAPIRVKDAPSKFGRVTFELRRSGSALVLEYNLASAPGQARAAAVHLHLPRTAEPVQSVQVNGQTRPLSPGQAVITI